MTSALRRWKQQYLRLPAADQRSKRLGLALMAPALILILGGVALGLHSSEGSTVPGKTAPGPSTAAPQAAPTPTVSAPTFPATATGAPTQAEAPSSNPAQETAKATKTPAESVPALASIALHDDQIGAAERQRLQQQAQRMAQQHPQP